MARRDVRTIKEEANAAIDKSRWKKALECYLELEQLEPGDGGWSRRAGDMQKRLGRDADAMTCYARAAQRYAAGGFLVQAIAVCKVMLQIDPSHSETLHQLASMQQQRGIPTAPRGSAAASASGAQAQGQGQAASTPSRGSPVAAAAAPSPRPPSHASSSSSSSPAPARPPRPAAPVLGANAPLDTVSLGQFVPRSHATSFDEEGLSSGMILIPLDDDAEVELDNAITPPRLIAQAIEDVDLPDDLMPPRRALGVGDDTGTHAPVPVDDLDLADVMMEPVPELPIAAENALRTTPLFSNLGPAALETLIENVSMVTLAAGETLFRQGDPGNALYVIVEGEVAVIHEGEPRVELTRLRDGDFFGEMAIVTEQPRNATIAGTAPTELLAIDRDTIGKLLGREPAVLRVLLRFLRDRLFERLLRTSPLFQPFTDGDRRSLAARFRFFELEPETALVTQGKRATGLFVLMSGRARAIRVDPTTGASRELAILGPGDLCGEMSLLNNEPAIASVTTISKALALELPAAAFREVIMTHPQVLAYVADLAEERRRWVEQGGPDRDDEWSDGHLDLE